MGDGDDSPPLSEFDRLLAAETTDTEPQPARRRISLGTSAAATGRPAVSDGSLLSRALWPEPAPQPSAALADTAPVSFASPAPSGNGSVASPAAPYFDTDRTANDPSDQSELFALLDPPSQPALTPEEIDATAQAALDDVQEYSRLHPSSPPPLTFERPVRQGKKRRSTSVLDWIALVLAIVVAPLGVVVSIAAVITGIVRNGWSSRVAKTGVAIGLVLSLGWAGAALILQNDARDAAAEAAIVSDSAPFCAAIESTKILDTDDFAWPAVGDTVTISLKSMHKYQKTWASLVAKAPAGVVDDVTRVKNVVDGLVTSVETSRSIDNSGNVSTMRSARAATAIPAYVGKYCP